jgi:hypothetical protein
MRFLDVKQEKYLYGFAKTRRRFQAVPGGQQVWRINSSPEPIFEST